MLATSPVDGGAVGADDAEIDQFFLHQMPAGIVGDQRMRHAMRAKLERRERSALVARPRLVHPHMDFDALVMRAIDRRKRRAPVDASEPAGIAMGEDVDHRPILLVGMRADDAEPMLAYSAVGLHILVADRGGAGEGGGDALVARLVAYRLLHLVERPAKIDGGGTRGGKHLASPVERCVGGVVAQPERDPVGGGRADQRRPPHLHA